MTEKYRIPNFRKLYPEASDQVIAVLRKTERQMQYQERDIKTEVIKVNQKKKTVTYVPSREDSLERLQEIDQQLSADQPSVEDEVMRRLLSQELYTALNLLPEDERQLIVQLYFFDKTERELGELQGVYHNAIHKRKLRILSKLKRIIDGF